MGTRVTWMIWPLVVVLLLACAPPSRPTAATEEAPVRVSTPKRMVAAIRGNPPTLSATISGASGRGKVPGVPQVETLVHAGLGVLDDKGERRPQLAEALPSVERGTWRVSPDGRMETSWTLRDGVLWHDGTPFTSDDLLFTATVLTDKAMTVFRERAYDAIESVEAPDPRTFVVRWSRPYIDADLLFTHVLTLPMPRHVLGRPYAEEKATFTDLPYWNYEFVGVGPFQLKQWVEGSHVTLTANERYVLGRPRIDEVEVRYIPDANTIVANLLSGALDLTMGRGISLEQGLQIRDQWREGRMDAATGNAVALYPQLINPTPAALVNLPFRRALLHAIDRQQIADTLMAGQVPVAHSIVDPGSPLTRATEASVIRYDYDPRATAQLLETLGHTRGADGTYRDAAGQRLSIEIQAVLTTDINEKAMMAVADDWQRAGIGATTVQIPIQRQGDREWRATRTGFDLAGGGSGSTALARFVSSEAPLPENNYVGSNKTRYMNPEYDAIVDRYFTTIPWAERAQAASQLVRHASEQLIVMGLVYDAEATMVANRLQKASGMLPADALATWNAHEWDVRER
jgi:peptide/nickel transport system substrate-binding protein